MSKEKTVALSAMRAIALKKKKEKKKQGTQFSYTRPLFLSY
jgi:hypothetical protein